MMKTLITTRKCLMEKGMNFVCRVGVSTAQSSVQKACPGFLHQPKVPKVLLSQKEDKLRKFN